MRRHYALLLAAVFASACTTVDSTITSDDSSEVGDVGGSTSGASGHTGFGIGGAGLGAGGAAAGLGGASHAGGSTGPVGPGPTQGGGGSPTPMGQGAGAAAGTMSSGQGAGAGAGAGAGTGAGTGGGATDNCAPSPGASCHACCASAYPNGPSAYNIVLGQCACSGACVSACSADCAAQALTTTACNDCLDQAYPNNQCSFADCSNDPQCFGYWSCNSKCAADPTGAGGSSSQGAGGSGTGTGGSPTGQYACPSDAGDPFAAARIECVKTINMYRATENLAPYKRWCGIQACTDAEPKADRAADTAHSAFGKCGEWAQNECPGWPDSPLDNIDGCLKMMWEEGPGSDFEKHGHYINMSSTMYTMVECGFNDTGDWWGVQDFQ